MNYFHTIADFVNLNLYPDISSSRYDIDNVGGSSIRMIKFPFTYEPGPEDLTWQPFFEGALSYMKAHSSYRNIEKLIGWLDTDEDPPIVDRTNAEVEWTGYSGLIGIGVKMPVSDTWSFRPSVDLAWSHFVNDTEFSGPGAHDFQELLDGVNTNWVLDTITYVGSLRFDYRREVGKTMCHFTGKYSHMHTDFLHDDHILNDFHASNNILTGQIDFKGPFELSIRENKLGWDLFAAHYRFEGEVGSLLGVVDFYSEAGFFIRTDFYKKKLVAESLSLGFSYVFGDHIEGLTFRLSAKL